MNGEGEASVVERGGVFGNLLIKVKLCSDLAGLAGQVRPEFQLLDRDWSATAKKGKLTNYGVSTGWSNHVIGCCTFGPSASALQVLLRQFAGT